ncbi:uncharacterized protein LOC117113944 [Anneissia japonica]|uniref:uncharacterized protein LOC117113944 n=1 Tax=Anneissia japonica TaxID=1529436 RepID=UPI00142560D5|nr:uncharacterized protein LOC117113944 [Anneissia japonica]
MFRRRTGIKVQRHFVYGRKGTYRQRPSRVLLYGSGNTGQTSACIPPVIINDAEQPIKDVEVEPQPARSSRHYERKQSELNDWMDATTTIDHALLGNWAPHSKNCKNCNAVLNTEFIRCLDCGPTVVYCHTCMATIHQHNVLHFPEVWTCNTFLPYSSGIKAVNTGHSSECGVSVWRIVNAFDDKGRCHHLNIKFCSCEEEVTTIIKLNLWPATAKCVKVAFSIELLKWMEVLLLECQVSTKGFCEALTLKNDLQPFEVNQLKELIRKETVFEFRHSYYKMRNISDDGTVCPACPKDGGTKFVSLDANFGLVRKKNSGHSLEPPKHENRYFVADGKVQEFVGHYNDCSSSKECHRFKAGDKVRSKSCSDKMDITGVFGCVCRHEFPIKFMNLQHGERLAYPVFLLHNLLSSAATDQHLNITYDIACVLFSHLKKEN